MFNSIVGYAIIFLLMFLGLNPMASNFFGYLISFTISYFTHKKFSFSTRTASTAAYGKYALVVLIAYFSNLYILEMLISDILINEYLAQVIAGSVYIGLSFILTRRFVFVDNKNES